MPSAVTLRRFPPPLTIEENNSAHVRQCATGNDGACRGHFCVSVFAVESRLRLRACARVGGTGRRCQKIFARKFWSPTAEVRWRTIIAICCRPFNVVIIVVVGALMFYVIDKFTSDRRLANLLKILVVLISLAGILQRLLPVLEVGF